MAKKVKHWTESELIDTFGLIRVLDPTPLLKNWLAVAPFVEAEQSANFPIIFHSLRSKVDYWNEQELELFFIAPLLSNFIDYDSPHFVVYSERVLEAEINGTYLKVQPDLLLAKGVGEIVKTPYFCFHEYKRTKKSPDDPTAQVLLAMLIAQERNKNNKPVYGAYVIGKDWYFMTMEGKEYCISKGYEATQKEELLQIIAILRQFRVILETTLL